MAGGGEGRVGRGGVPDEIETCVQIACSVRGRRAGGRSLLSFMMTSETVA